MENSISKIRTAWAIESIYVCGGFNRPGHTYFAAVGPHQKGSVSRLTMGDYQNYFHTQITVAIIGGKTFIRKCAAFNNHPQLGSQFPYKKGDKIPGVSAEDMPLVESLIDQLFEKEIDSIIETV